ILNLTTVSSSITLIAIIILFAAHLLPSRYLDYEKASPYECGFDPLNSARVPFSFRFFLVAILFLLFDLEISLLFPFPPSNFINNPLISSSLATIFLIILVLGLIFEWLQGGLDWAE
uniref:NADH dehydrogenase subunit 3 n=1 Tax=Leptychaster arcticus TaxID=3048001 RepID=UPI00286A8C7D